MIRVLLADDHPAFREGVGARLGREPDIEVVGMASDGGEAIQLVKELSPDVLVLDIEMPGASGIDVVDALADAPEAPHILVLSGYDEPSYVFGVLDRGVAGFLNKQEPLAVIVEAIRGVASGELGWLSRRISAMLQRRGAVSSRQKPDPVEEAGISEREREVLVLVADGLVNHVIAERLFISESTVKKHVNAIYEKTGARSRAAVVAWAWREGVVTKDPA